MLFTLQDEPRQTYFSELGAISEQTVLSIPGNLQTFLQLCSCFALLPPGSCPVLTSLCGVWAFIVVLSTLSCRIAAQEFFNLGVFINLASYAVLD